MLGKYSKGFFVAGLSVACFLSLLPLLLDLHNSNGFDVIKLILFPASLLVPFAENLTRPAYSVTALFLAILNGVIYALVGVLLDNVVPALMTKNKRREPLVPIADLPLWRRTVVVCALVLYALSTTVVIGTGWTICTFRPDRPDSATGQVYRVDDACHGSVKYLTMSEKQSYEFWRNLSFRYAGPLFVVAFFLWAPVRPRGVGPLS